MAPELATATATTTTSPSPPGHVYPEAVRYPFPAAGQPAGTALTAGEGDEAVRRIRAEQARLQQRRQRLVQLALIDEQEARLERVLERQLEAVARGRQASVV